MLHDDHLWEEIFRRGLDFAFQPILDVASGRIFGYEALLRHYDRNGFASVFELLDFAYEQRNLYSLDLLLRKLALQRFIELPDARKRRLFYNIDNRLLEMPDYRPGNTRKVLDELGLPPSLMVFEISERHQFQSLAQLREIIRTYREQGFRIAVDDYGVGFSGLQLIYSLEPDIVKLDRFFITGVDQDPKRRVFLHHVVQLAHLMGGMVVAEGIETEAEYEACVKIGCDLVQGFYIGRPIFVEDSGACGIGPIGVRRELHPFSNRKAGLQIDRPEPILPTMQFEEIMVLIRGNPEFRTFPVVNEFDEPLGLLDRVAFKSIASLEHVQEQYPGGVKEFLRDHLRKCYVADLNAEADEILKIFSLQGNQHSLDGILVTDGGRYAGFLSSAAMLRYIYQERIEQAREENPLTGLPGNRSIMRFLEDAAHRVDPTTVVYIDLDHFKPFNDRFGFQKGDLALLSIGASLKRLAENDRSVFAGHVGGDDFFLGFYRASMFSILREVWRIRREFAIAREGLLDPTDMERGFFESTNRYGQRQRFPLPELSIAVLRFDEGRVPLGEISHLVADAKNEAKSSAARIILRRFSSSQPETV